MKLKDFKTKVTNTFQTLEMLLEIAELIATETLKVSSQVKAIKKTLPQPVKEKDND